MKTALLFAGQGAQCVGMGQDLASRFPRAQQLFEQADTLLDTHLSDVCFCGPEERLVQTEQAQPGIYLVSWVTFTLLREALPNLTYDATAGLSLGEFTALAAANVYSFEDGLRLVRDRGRFMQEACEGTSGGMAAIIGLDEARTRQVCEQTGVTLANLNCPGQIVVSGSKERIPDAIASALAAGARKAIALPVAGAYHSPLMASAQPKLAAVLAKLELNAPSVPVLSNVTGKPHIGPDTVAARLIEQVTAPVRWEDGIRHLIADGFERFIELGPGNALSGFMKRIDKSVECLQISDVPSFERAIDFLQTNQEV